MGDLRNKIAKIERAKRDKEAMEAFLRRGGWKPEPRLPAPRTAPLPMRPRPLGRQDGGGQQGAGETDDLLVPGMRAA